MHFGQEKDVRNLTWRDMWHLPFQHGATRTSRQVRHLLITCTQWRSNAHSISASAALTRWRHGRQQQTALQMFCYKRVVNCFGSCIVLKLKSFLFYYRQKNVVYAVQSEVNLNEIGSLRRKMNISPNSTWLDSTRVSSPCILVVSTLSNSTARLARHDESDSQLSLLCNFCKVMITVIHVLFNVSYSLIYWFWIYLVYFNW